MEEEQVVLFWKIHLHAIDQDLIPMGVAIDLHPHAANVRRLSLRGIAHSLRQFRGEILNSKETIPLFRQKGGARKTQRMMVSRWLTLLGPHQARLNVLPLVQATARLRGINSRNLPLLKHSTNNLALPKPLEVPVIGDMALVTPWRLLALLIRTSTSSRSVTARPEASLTHISFPRVWCGIKRTRRRAWKV